MGPAAEFMNITGDEANARKIPQSIWTRKVVPTMKKMLQYIARGRSYGNSDEINDWDWSKLAAKVPAEAAPAEVAPEDDENAAS